MSGELLTELQTIPTHTAEAWCDAARAVMIVACADLMQSEDSGAAALTEAVMRASQSLEIPSVGESVNTMPISVLRVLRRSALSRIRGIDGQEPAAEIASRLKGGQAYFSATKT